MTPEIEVLIAQIEGEISKATAIRLAIVQLNKDSVRRWPACMENWRKMSDVIWSSRAIMDELQAAVGRPVAWRGAMIAPTGDNHDSGVDK